MTGWRALARGRIQQGATWDAGSDPLVVSAARLLKCAGYHAPDLSRASVIGHGLRPLEARYLSGRQWTQIAGDGEAYAWALQQAEIAPLAGVALHEAMHARHGAGETRAFHAELEFLLRVDTPRSWLRMIQGLARAAERAEKRG